MKILVQKLLILSGCFLALIIFADVANACSCSNTETVIQKFKKSENVVILKLQSVKTNEQAGFRKTYIGWYVLVVEKVFKGNLKVGEILDFTTGSVCSWGFKEEDAGNEYLFYLDGKPANGEMWQAGYCSGSGQTKKMSADLLYLEKEKEMRGKTRLSGTLDKIVRSTETGDYTFYSLAGKVVRVVGKGKNIELVTDKNGVYEIYDLSPGKYKIIPPKVDGFTFTSFDNTFSEIEIKPKSHNEEVFFYNINNAVGGTVFSPDGKPLENVCLDLILADEKRPQNFSSKACTNKKGEFEINEIPVGTYILAINKDDEVRLYEPFHTFYYPNVKNKEQATKITVLENTFIKDLKLTPLEMIETVTISGVLQYKNGEPVIDQNVNFISEKEIFRTFDGKVGSDDKVYTDEKGRFSFIIWKGQMGVLRSSIFSYLGEYKNCPEIDDLVRQKGDSVQQIDTIDVEIDANESLSNVQLKFPFSKCEEAEDEEEDEDN